MLTLTNLYQNKTNKIKIKLKMKLLLHIIYIYIYIYIYILYINIAYVKNNTDRKECLQNIIISVEEVRNVFQVQTKKNQKYFCAKTVIQPLKKKVHIFSIDNYLKEKYI